MLQEQVLRRVIRELAAADWQGTPLDIGMPVHRLVREVTGVDDPFARAKQEATRSALRLLPELRKRVEAADEPLWLAVRLAVAGNVIDLGAQEDFDLDATLERVLTARFGIDHYAALRDSLKGCRSVLLFADNAGEVVFDRLLLETIAALWQPRFSVVVKSGPFINDVTAGDAQYAGLTEIPRLQLLEINNGDDDGAPSYASPEVDEWLNAHDVVISKGQANYEGLSDHAGIFFLLIAKCPFLAQSVGTGVGDFVIKFSS